MIDDKIENIKNELFLLKSKYKSKSEKLKKANEQIVELTVKLYRRNIYDHISYLRYSLMRELTNHIDEHCYSIEYIYDSKSSEEPEIYAFGSRWLKESLCIFLATERKLIIHTCDIKIINAKMLW
jgi:nitrogenase molybdenum-iron protein alpha/beta subunit